MKETLYRWNIDNCTVVETTNHNRAIEAVIKGFFVEYSVSGVLWKHFVCQ